MLRRTCTLVLSLPFLSLMIAPLALGAPTLEATQESALSDANGDSLPNPGEQIEYVVTVRNNSSEDASSLAFSTSVDPNVTISSTVKIASSGAFDDCYGTSTTTSIAPGAALPGFFRTTLPA